MPHRYEYFSMSYSAGAEPSQEITWRPLTDVYRTNAGWLLKFELAGVELDDILVTVQGSAVTVSGVRRDRHLEPHCWHYLMEIPYSRFERTVHLPCQIESAGIAVESANGILLVRIAV